jgi:phage-related protein
MRNQIEIQQAFRVYERKMSRVYQELNSIKESCSYREQELLMEGFWDKLKSAASGAGSFLGKTTQKVANFSSDVYNKGIELGKKAVDISKELVNKVSEVTKNAVVAIKSAPGRLFDACKDIYASISNEVGEIYKKAKEKGGEFLENAKTTIVNMYNKVASDLSEGITTFKNWASKNIEEFKKMTEEKKADLLEAAKSAESSANETVKKIGYYMKSFYEKGKDAAKNVGYFSIGLVILPFYASYQFAKKTYELGEETVSVIGSGIESIKNNVPEVWAEFTKSFQEGRESEKRPEVSERHIQTFESFVYKNY